MKNAAKNMMKYLFGALGWYLVCWLARHGQRLLPDLHMTSLVEPTLVDRFVSLVIPHMVPIPQSLMHHSGIIP